MEEEIGIFVVVDLSNTVDVLGDGAHLCIDCPLVFETAS